MLTATDLRRTVRLPGGGTLAVLQGVDLEVRAGESVAIVGRSGSGKTTLLAQLGLLSPVSGGRLEILGIDVSSISDRRRARMRNRSIGYVFQSYSLVRHLSALKNVELALLYGARTGRRERRRRSRAALAAVGLTDRARSRPKHLSGGEQQRVAIARALVREPALILADEPTGALDVDTAASVLDVLLKATRERGCALVVVTHDEAVAAQMSRRVVMHEGTIRTTPALDGVDA
ncbi:ABC transporter ATP-binding protein [Sanguibacter antarcticus]|uniref:ABC transporter ATP-binding protein n=1 Tax=Sanguibacter antarcticus TaxID=372484 RepID=UPI001473218B|nr:ABC transporter ATP-binding protein [Sanguibacter antarcticus]